MPRVVAGECRGVKLVAPSGEKTRPTTDKIKEALFSILQRRIPDCSFLDLFGGSGQMGIEAVSRGARMAVIVEENNSASEAILTNLRKTKLQDRTRFMKRDVFRALSILSQEKSSFDIIFMDPPYSQAFSLFMRIAAVVSQENLLEPGGLMILEHSTADELPENVMNLTLYRRCKYGTTMLTFYTTDANYNGGILSK
jgi:16S rRNA (guanine966-N2)-methyltransferase